MSEWKPIELAPKDAVIWAFNGEQVRMKWILGEGYSLWVYDDAYLRDVDPDPVQPTHWQPLPPPPNASTGRSDS